MNCISYLQKQGLQVSARGKRVVVSPRRKVTDGVRHYIKRNRLNILAELEACDGKERRTYWKIKLPGAASFSMIGQPMTIDEALTTALNIWPEAKIDDTENEPSQQRAVR